MHFRTARGIGVPGGAARGWGEQSIGTRALQDPQAWLMLGLVWMLALAGGPGDLAGAGAQSAVVPALYVALGWLVLVAALPALEQISAAGVRLLVAGGAVYTVGALLFLLGARVRFAYLVWHLFVMVGSGLHAAAVLEAC